MTCKLCGHEVKTSVPVDGAVICWGCGAKIMAAMVDRIASLLPTIDELDAIARSLTAEIAAEIPRLIAEGVIVKSTDGRYTLAKAAQ